MGLRLEHLTQACMCVPKPFGLRKPPCCEDHLTYWIQDVPTAVPQWRSQLPELSMKSALRWCSRLVSEWTQLCCGGKAQGSDHHF